MAWKFIHGLVLDAENLEHAIVAFIERHVHRERPTVLVASPDKLDDPELRGAASRLGVHVVAAPLVDGGWALSNLEDHALHVATAAEEGVAPAAPAPAPVVEAPVVEPEPELEHPFIAALKSEAPL